MYKDYQHITNLKTSTTMKKRKETYDLKKVKIDISRESDHAREIFRVRSDNQQSDIYGIYTDAERCAVDFASCVANTIRYMKANNAHRLIITCEWI